MRWFVLLDICAELLWSSSLCLCLSTDTESYMCFNGKKFFSKMPYAKCCFKAFAISSNSPSCFYPFAMVMHLFYMLHLLVLLSTTKTCAVHHI